MLADGGRCVSDLAALAGQRRCSARSPRSPPRGGCCSRSASRSSISYAGRGRGPGSGRGRRGGTAAGGARVRPTPIRTHSEKELAAGHYKGGFGFHPLLVSCGREVLAGILRPGNAGANNADDHPALDGARARPPERARRRDPRALASRRRQPRLRFAAARPTSASRWATRSPSPSARRCSRSRSGLEAAVAQGGQPREGTWVTSSPPA